MQELAHSIRKTEAELLEHYLRKLCKSLTDKEITGKCIFEFVFYKNGGMGDKPTIYHEVQGDLSDLN